MLMQEGRNRKPVSLTMESHVSVTDLLSKNEIDNS